MREVPRFGSDLALTHEVKSLKHALEVERKEKLTLDAQQYEKSCQFLGELQDKDSMIKSRDAEINDMRREAMQLKLCLSEHASASAGIVPSDVRVVTLENEVQAAHLEMSTLRAWNRQLDDAFNEEVNVAAQYAATASQPRLTSVPQAGSNLPPGDGQRSVGDRPSGSNLPPGDGSTRNLRPGGDPPGDDPPDDDVGSDVEDGEHMHDHAEDDIDDYAEFDDDEQGYSPSVGPDEDEVDHDIEVEEEHEDDRNEDDEDIIDVDEEDGSVRLSKR
eukprot:s1934_g1.t1